MAGPAPTPNDPAPSRPPFDPPPPAATYRLQLRGGLGFAEVAALVPELAALGVTHLYLAPPFRARAGSTHGYDVADPTRLDPALGGEAGFAELAKTARRHGLGLVVDIVPNHMGVGPDNPWWWDVLRHGRSSRYAGFFDIDFDRDPEGRLVLPVLGSPLEEAVRKGEIGIENDPERGGPVLVYYTQRFPLHPASGIPQDADPESLLRLIAGQPYRLVPWTEGASSRNYRRFFNIDELAGLRVEIPEVFEAAHALILELVAKGQVQGLRVDHVDGLADPKAYLERLQRRLKEVRAHPAEPAGPGARGAEAPFWVVVEKILVGEERLRQSWPVAGTTGYEVMNAILGVLIDPAGLGPLEDLRAEATGEPEPFATVVDAAKRLVLKELFPGELAVLAQKAREITGLPEDALGAALTELVVAFPVYRTYRRPPSGKESAPLEQADAVVLEQAFGAAGPQLQGAARDALERLRELIETEPDAARQAWVQGLQQLTGPVMAKALEDTAFYRFPRLLALNEVGGEPDAPGLTPARFHDLQIERQRTWPFTLLATATHDTKRGEDARMRLAVLSEIPDAWARAVRAWREVNAAIRPAELHPKDEYTLYQTLLGVWPADLGPTDAEALKGLAERVQGWLVKALREGKERSGWAPPNEAYERAALGFAADLLDASKSLPFLAAFREFVDRVAAAGAVNGLSQLVLKLALPGVPDIYQGTEGWDLALVDPDNRRPVDWAARRRRLNDARPWAELLTGWPDGALKARVMRHGLRLRREYPDLFTLGAYRPLAVEGPLAAHALAFARTHGNDVAVAVVARHVAGLLGDPRQPLPDPLRWADTALVLPEDLLGRASGSPGALTDAFSGAGLVPDTAGRLPLADVLARLPVALLAGRVRAG